MSEASLSATGHDEVEEVLAVLRELSEKVSSPMIRVCLESARDDIAHLVGSGAESPAA